MQNQSKHRREQLPVPYSQLVPRKDTHPKRSTCLVARTLCICIDEGGEVHNSRYCWPHVPSDWPQVGNSFCICWHIFIVNRGKFADFERYISSVNVISTKWTELLKTSPQSNVSKLLRDVESSDNLDTMHRAKLIESSPSIFSVLFYPCRDSPTWPFICSIWEWSIPYSLRGYVNDRTALRRGSLVMQSRLSSPRHVRIYA